jgi:hypothetical protein
MLLLDDCPGATQEDIDKMTDEINDRMITAYHCPTLRAAREWAEDRVLSKYGYR